MSSKLRIRNTVYLTAYTREGQQVLDDQLPVQRFYEKSHPALDDAQFRKTSRIVRLRGVIYNAQGTVSQEFEVQFDSAGLCVCDAARFADGSVVGNWDLMQRSKP